MKNPLERGLPDDVRHALSRIESESVRMSGLVDDLLLLARLDEGRQLARDRVDLSRLLVDAVVEYVGLPLIVCLPTAAGVAARADEGEPPSLRDAYGRACSTALASLARELGAAA